MGNRAAERVHGIRRAEEQWGTVITLDVRDDIEVRAVDACFAWFQRIDELFSTWRPETEIMRIGRGSLRREDASPEVRAVLDLSEQMRVQSNGAFDIAVGARPDVPPRAGRAPLDPSGIVKGWAMGKAATLLRNAGATSFFVSAGGDLFAAGSLGDERAWRVGVQHPWERDRVAAVLEISDCAVATSGCYERGDHVIDPRSGRPAAGLASVTVVGPDAAVADAYATATMVLGPVEGMRWLEAQPGYEGMTITDHHTVTTTSGLDRYRV